MERKKLDIFDFLTYLKSLSNEELADLFWCIHIFYADKASQEKREKIQKIEKGE